MKTQTPSQKIGISFENYTDLATLVRLSKRGHTACAYLLNQVNAKGKSKDRLQLVFGFTCEGIHPFIRPGIEKKVASALERGFKEIPQGERFIIKWSSFSTSEDAELDLKQRIKNSCSLENEFIDWSALGRTQQLAKSHLRNLLTLNIYFTFTLKSPAESGDALDQGIAEFFEFWQRSFQDQGAEINQKRLIKYLEKALDASIAYAQILTQMGLSPKIKDEKVLWGELTKRLGANSTAVPHLLVYDDRGLREEFPNTNSDCSKPVKVILGSHLHAASRLLNNGTPFADRHWVKVGDKYVAAMTLASKPAGFDGDLGQLRYLWEVFSREGIYDVEVITEISPANKSLVRSTLQFLTRYSISRKKTVHKQGTVDVSADINQERSVEAQKRLFQNDLPVYTAVVVLIYRSSPEELDDASRKIASYIYDPAELARESEYTWLIWLQTLGIRQEPLLLRPFNRRLSFFTSEVAGLTNLIKPARFDPRGFELITEEGGAPVKINVAKTDQAMNMLVLGTTGAGKSLLVAQIIAECLAENLSFLILDLPNDDGTGTFGDFTPFFNGAYFDISKESNNILELPNLANVINKEERERLHRNDVNLIITQLVLGSGSLDGLLIDTIESLIPLGIAAFYRDPLIKKRFADAAKAGIGTTAWKNTPTLIDLEKYFSREYIEANYKDEYQDRALNHIRLRLQYWRESAIGNAICRPSSFRSDSKLITFALTNIQTGKEAEVLALSAYLAAARQALSSPQSAFFMDEASVLLKYPAFAQLVGRKFATARKSGSRTIVAGQDANSINSSAYSSQILENIQCTLIGRIAPEAVESTSKILKISPEVLENNTSFTLNKNLIYTNWLLRYYNKDTFCRYYPPFTTLSLAINSRKEQALRNHYKQKFSDKFESISHFQNHYVNCSQTGKEL